MANKFDTLVEDLVSGRLGFTHIQIAMRASIRQRKDLPDGIKDLLAGRDATYSGLIFKQFKVIQETIGAMELAYRRGTDFKE